MLRKGEHSQRQIAVSRVAGYWAFAILNVPLIMVTLLLFWADMPGWLEDFADMEFMSILPWIFNSTVILLGLILDPQFMLGYSIALASVCLAALLYLPSCFATCAAVLVIESMAGPGSRNREPVIIVFNAAFLLFWVAAGVWWSRRTLRRAK